MDWPKPLFRPGWWVMFYDPTVPDLGHLVGRIEFAVKVDNKTTYEIAVGYTRHSVSKRWIIARMVEQETE